jgi:tetratricopeptide (TPR) repeat protein
MDKPSAKISLSAVVCLAAVVAVVFYATAGKLKPSNDGSYYHVVRYKEAKPVDAAEASLTSRSKIEALEKDQAASWKLESAIKLNRLYKTENMHEKATEVLKDALQREKNPVAVTSILNWLVPTLIKQQRWAEAELYARQAIKDENEKNAHPLELALDWGVLGRILVKQNKLSQARDAFEKVMHYRTISDTKPENWEAYRAFEMEELGAIYCRLGDWKKAQPLLEEALQIHESHKDETASVWALDCLKRLYTAEGKKEDADKCKRKLADIEERRPSAVAELERPAFDDSQISSEASPNDSAR